MRPAPPARRVCGVGSWAWRRRKRHAGAFWRACGELRRVRRRRHRRGVGYARRSLRLRTRRPIRLGTPHRYLRYVPCWDLRWRPSAAVLRLAGPQPSMEHRNPIRHHRPWRVGGIVPGGCASPVRSTDHVESLLHWRRRMYSPWWIVELYIERMSEHDLSSE